MKYVLFFLINIFCCIAITPAQNYEPQGTTVKNVGCDVMLIIQIAVDHDSTGDIAMLQSALDGCFGLTCDLPCGNGKWGKCKVITKVNVVQWSSLGNADKPKFHHVTMLSGSGVSSVDEVGVPNNGSSSSGSWYRNEYSPKVYCHEVMHLAGLDDHYRDCRANRLALGVDNCKDGDTCTAAQKARGACPSCPGYEDDVMGSNVTKPIDCNRDIIEILRLANNPLHPAFICSDSCCEDTHRTSNRVNNPTLYLVGGGGLGYYHLQNETNKDDKLNMYGIHGTLGINITFELCRKMDLDGHIRFGYTSVSTSNTTTQNFGQGNVTSNNHYGYRLGDVTLGADARYKVSNAFSLYIGPEAGTIVLASSKNYGTTTFNNMTTPYGSNSFTKITDKNKIQFGINLGAIKDMNMPNRRIKPYLNIYIPLTNEIDYGATKNKLYKVDVGVRFR